MAEPQKPVYLRLRDIIAAAILDGSYADGDALPSVRSFAADQSANPLTVAKAYQTFQDQDLIEVKRGIGLFVAKGASAKLRQLERARFMRETWPPVREQMALLDIGLPDLLERERA